MKKFFPVILVMIFLTACSSNAGLKPNDNNSTAAFQKTAAGTTVIEQTSAINSNTAVEKTEIDNAPVNIEAQGVQIIENQSFWVSFENWGKVRFISSVYEKVGLNKARFYLVNDDNQVLYQFPEFMGNDWPELDDIYAISFKDVNNDGLKDIIIIAYYMTGVGEDGAKSFPVCSIYFQKESSFINSPELDNQINDSDQNASIKSVLEYIKRKDNEKSQANYGYIDKKGNIVIKLQFSDARNFSEGLAQVQINEKWGFIDNKGNIAIQPQFDSAGSFHEGLAHVKVNNKWGFIDKKGNIVIQPQFDNAFSFSEGLVSVCINNKHGYIDESGRIAIKPQYDFAGDFHEGLAGVEINGKWGFINKTGEIVIKPQFESLSVIYFSEGLAMVNVNDKYGYIDTTGNIVIKPEFDNGFDFFSEGLASVSLNYSWIYIDKKGNTIVIPQYDEEIEEAYNFSEGLARIKIAGDTFGFIDKTGKRVIEAQFYSADDFSEGLSAVYVDNKYGYIDKSGKLVIKSQFDRAESFSEGLACVKAKNAYIRGKYEEKEKKKSSEKSF